MNWLVNRVEWMYVFSLKNTLLIDKWKETLGLSCPWTIFSQGEKSGVKGKVAKSYLQDWFRCEHASSSYSDKVKWRKWEWKQKLTEYATLVFSAYCWPPECFPSFLETKEDRRVNCQLPTASHLFLCVNATFSSTKTEHDQRSDWTFLSSLSLSLYFVPETFCWKKR